MNTPAQPSTDAVRPAASAPAVPRERWITLANRRRARAVRLSWMGLIPPGMQR